MLTWTVAVDWDGDGILEADEGPRLTGLTVDRGRQRRFGSRAWEPMRVGRLVATLDNYDGRYAAWNTSSPLYPGIVPGREALVQVSDGVTTWDVMTGTVQDVAVYGYGSPQAQLVVEDGWRWLKDQAAYTAVVENIRTGEAVGAILTAADWPWGRTLDAGNDRIPLWWAHGEAARQINDLAAFEAGFAYVAGNGDFKFISRNNVYAVDPVDTVTQDELLKDVALAQPIDSLRNVIRVLASPRVEAAEDDVWKLSTPQLVKAGATETIYAELRTPVVDAVTPVATTDYVFNSAADGSGTDLTANLSVTLTAYGQRLVLVLNNTGGTPGYVTLLKVRAKLLEVQDALAAEVEDTTSQTDYRVVRLYEEASDYMQTWLRANNKAAWLLYQMKTPVAVPVVQFEARAERQFGHELGTVVQLDIEQVGLDKDFLIGGLRHRWLDGNGQAVRTSWYLELTEGLTYWQWDVSRWGVSTRWGP